MSFNFSAPECHRCGNFLSEHGADCGECSEDDLRRYHFDRFVGSDEIRTVWAINPTRAWHELAVECNTVLPWRCVESGATSLDMAQMGVDVRNL